MSWLGMLIKQLNIIALNVLIKKSSFYWNRDITLAAGTPNLLQNSTKSIFPEGSFKKMKTSMRLYSLFVCLLLGSFTANAQPTAYAFLDISGKVIKQKAEIKWQVSQELSLDYFNLQRSYDGSDFQTITSPAAKGRTSGINTYSYSDPSPATGTEKIFYRLQCVDKNGGVSYSSILKLQLRTRQLSLTILSSGIIREELNLNISGTGEEKGILFITNQSGVVVKQQSLDLFNGSFIQPVDVSGLSKGMYFISIKTASAILRERFLKK
jgi:hypothetical protein